jgi:sugar O-acyltransferase (sialic acid O-acetyltransferase NeuD family)
MQKVILAGSAVTAEILLAYLKWDVRYEVVGCTVDDDYLAQGGLADYRTVALSEVVNAFSPNSHRVIMAMGYNDLNRAREEMFTRLKFMGYAVETYIHPDARVYTDKVFGEGSVVLAGAIIEPHAQVGSNTMVWCNVTLAHHSDLGDHCWAAAGTVISGQAKVRHNTFLGVGSIVVNAVTVGEFNVIGAGALISRNTQPYTVHLARSAEPFRCASEDYIKYFGI